jgi:hypothetical protein
LQHGDRVEWFLALEAEGETVSELDDMPVLAGLEFYWEAWNELSTCRSFGVTAGPIPWLAIDQYCRGMDYELRYVVHKVVRALDRKFLDYAKKEREKKKQRDAGRARAAHRAPRTRGV